MIMQLPDYPNCRELQLGDKPLFASLFRDLQPRISEFTFAGLYLFRTAHAYRVTRLGDAVALLGKGYDGTGYALPPFTGDRLGAGRRLLAEGWELYGADEWFLNEVARQIEVSSREDRDNFDYLYLREELAALPGNRFHKKKNRVNYFTSRHPFTVEVYREELRDGCLALLDDWRRVHDSLGNSSLSHEIRATAEALARARELELEGVVVLVAGEVKGFALGERLNATTSVCHFQKADPFLDGLYQLVDREFSRLLFTECTYLNKEQDLGEPNLRKSKLSYHPAELVRKYRIGLKVTGEQRQQVNGEG